jgi:plastocyanin domain-containing protein
VIGLINLVGLVLIGLIIWWFRLYRPAATSVQSAESGEALTIRVESGVYLPSRIQLPAEEPATLRFLRIDSTPCAEMVLFDDLGIAQELALDRTTDVRLPPLPAGRYPFTCQMKMYRGELVVVEKA